ncbi:hypothetical protein IMZ48_36235 [Candidatus Bathyarchaeota archaeon]|nr:hypothetical protein [Candidatus Bathyarchaeota archaeon]
MDLDQGAIKGLIIGVGGTAAVKAIGAIQFKLQNCLRGKGALIWTEHNMAYVPSLPVNLLSVSRCRQRGLEYDYKERAVVDIHSQRNVAPIEIRGGVYCFVTTGESLGTLD